MKFIAKFLIFIVVIAIATVAGVTFYLDSIAKKAIEYGGSEALGVTTTLDKIHISVLDGSSSLNGLAIANPKGYSATNFMALDQATVAIDIKSITSDIIHISEISLTGLQLNLEQSSQASNAKTIMGNLPQGSTTTQQTPPAKKETDRKEAKTTPSSSDKKFIIDNFELSGISVTAKLQALGANLSDISLNVPPIKRTEIGKAQGGLTMPELMQYIVKQVIDAVAKNSKSLSPALAAMLKGDLASVDGLKAGAIQAASAEVDKAAQKLLKDANLPEGSDAELQQAADTLIKGLFDKK